MIRLFAVMTAAVFYAPCALAQQPTHPAPDSVAAPASPVPPAADSAAVSLSSFARPNATLLRPDSAVYDITSTHDTITTRLGTRTVRVSESTFAGQPVWLIAESRTGTVVETSDSVVVSRSDLSPVRWSATNGRTQLAVSFTRDSLFGGFVGYQGHSSFSGALPADALLSPAMAEEFVVLLPLQVGYRAAASLVQVSHGSVRSVPATIAVERDDHPTIAGREVDCWLVTLRAGAIEERLWVTKATPMVVRTEQAVSTGLVTAVRRP